MLCVLAYNGAIKTHKNKQTNNLKKIWLTNLLEVTLWSFESLNLNSEYSVSQADGVNSATFLRFSVSHRVDSCEFQTAYIKHTIGIS